MINALLSSLDNSDFEDIMQWPELLGKVFPSEGKYTQIIQDTKEQVWYLFVIE
jgi:hypothetical protein